jgi:hypothetical protein
MENRPGACIGKATLLGGNYSMIKLSRNRKHKQSTLNEE